MNIKYTYIKEIDKDSLRELFISVEWDSGKYPEELQKAISNSHRVVSAWDGKKLIGLTNSISDGTLNVYFPYLLVKPEYQKRGIGKKLVETILEEYKDYARKVLIAEGYAVDFYKKFGFKVDRRASPMFIVNS